MVGPDLDTRSNTPGGDDPAEGGRQYHIGLAPGEVAPWVLLVGDPKRVDLAETLLDEVRERHAQREYRSITGLHGGREITVLGTGIGCDNTEIAIVELLRCRRRMTILRVGSCGALQDALDLGDLVVSTGAVRLESTSLGFVEEGYPALAHHEVVLAMTSAAEELGAPYHQGLTASTAGFYGWQGRGGPGLEPRHPDLPTRLARLGVLNYEMEASTLLSLASVAGLRAGVVCAVFAHRTKGEFVDVEAKHASQERALRVGLRTVAYLDRMDREAGGRPFHLRP